MLEGSSKTDLMQARTLMDLSWLEDVALALESRQGQQDEAQDLLLLNTSHSQD